MPQCTGERSQRIAVELNRFGRIIGNDRARAKDNGGSAMNDMMISADVGDKRAYDRAREADPSAAAGAQKLQQLHSLLDRAWFRDRHTVRFELETVGKGLSLHIVRPGDQVIASWTTRGDSLVFSTACGTEVRAEIMDCAVSITCEFLDQARARRN
jgi:hypothetical protein